MIILLSILINFLSAESLDASQEIIMKKFTPSGSIESLINNPDEEYYLVQLDLKNDSLYHIVNDIIPEANLLNGPASYHRIMNYDYLMAIQNVLSSDNYIILNDSYRLPNSSRSYWVEVHEGSNPEGTYTEDDAIEYTCACLDGASDCVKLGWDDGWYNPFDYYGEAWYAYGPPNYQSIEEIRVTVTGAQCDALPVWSENYMGMRDDSGNWNQDYELSIDYTANVFIVSEIWSNGMLMPQIGSEDNYVIDRVKLEFFYTCEGPEYSPYNILADDGVSCTEINVSWELSPSEFSSQNLYRDGDLIATLGPTEVSFIDYFATSGEHLYCIESVNECGVSPQSCNPGHLLSNPASPQNINASDGLYNNQVIVSWDETSNTDSYKIYRDNVWLGLNSSSDDTEYIDQITELGIIYEYCIESINECGESDFGCDTGFSSSGPGDVNGDGDINVLDVVTAVSYILSSDTIPEEILLDADLNFDGQLNVLDIVLIINMILYP